MVNEVGAVPYSSARWFDGSSSGFDIPRVLPGEPQGARSPFPRALQSRPAGGTDPRSLRSRSRWSTSLISARKVDAAVRSPIAAASTPLSME